MNYAQDALWWRLAHPAVRDLASLLTAPPLWHTGCELPVRELLGEHGFRLLLAWDEQWQSDPQRQPENLNRNRYALGKYAEDLLAYWFTHAPHAKLLAANLPIYSHNTDGNSADNSTLGEIDYIVELNGTPYHLELACKYHGSATGEHMAGLNPRDTLARKQGKLQRQLALLATPEAQAALRQHGIAPDNIRSASIVRGIGFTAAGTLPPAFPPQAWSGIWTTTPQALPEHARYYRLPRTEYLAPARITQPETISRSQITPAALYAQVAPRPDGYWHEEQRIMVVAG